MIHKLNKRKRWKAKNFDKEVNIGTNGKLSDVLIRARQSKVKCKCRPIIFKNIYLEKWEKENFHKSRKMKDKLRVAHKEIVEVRVRADDLKYEPNS